MTPGAEKVLHIRSSGVEGCCDNYLAKVSSGYWNNLLLLLKNGIALHLLFCTIFNLVIQTEIWYTEFKPAAWNDGLALDSNISIGWLLKRTVSIVRLAITIHPPRRSTKFYTYRDTVLGSPPWKWWTDLVAIEYSEKEESLSSAIIYFLQRILLVWAVTDVFLLFA